MLSSILPLHGEIQLWGLDQSHTGNGQRYPRPVWMNVAHLTDETLSQSLVQIQNDGATDFYFTIGSFEFEAGQPRRRLANMVKHLRSYAVDLDAHGKAGQYANPDEAYRALMQVSGQIGLMPTLAVNSGRGVQAYWTTAQDMSPKEWRNLSEHMVAVLRAYGLKPDPAVHGDRARMMRVPGTINSKSRTYSQVLYTGAPYDRRQLLGHLKKICDAYGIVPAPPPVEIVTHANSENEDVFPCEENEKRLRALIKCLPAVYEDDGDRGRYQLWRDTIWAIKRTGLDCAWDAAYDYAQRSSHAYDDWYQSLDRTWQSDKGGGVSEIKAGTLVYLARKYGRGMATGKMAHFRFLTEDDVAENREWEEQNRKSGLYSWPGSLGEDDIEPWFDLDAGCIPDDDEDWPDDEDEDPSIGCPAPPTPETLKLSHAQDPEWETKSTLHESRPIIFQPDDWGEGIGGPGSKLPDGLKWDRQGRGCLCKKPKAGGEDDEFDPEAGLQPVLDAPIAYIGRIQNLATEQGVKSQGYDVLRVYDITGRWQILHVPMADMENPAELLKIVAGHGGEICTGGGQKGAKLVSYLSILSREFRKQNAATGNTKIVKQGGWQRLDADDTVSPPVAFILGDKVLKRTGVDANFRLTSDGAEKNRYLGEQHGTLEGCKKILAAYNGDSHGALMSKVFCSWVLGTVLGEFLPHRQAVPYIYSNRGSKGKSSMAAIAYNAWGIGSNLMLNTGSTMASLRQYFSYRGCLPTFMDDVSAGNPRFSLEDYKNIILSSTQPVEAAASNSSGTGLARGSLLLKGALCLSGNVPLSRIMDDKSSSVEAAFRRVCLMRWAVMPEYDTSIPANERPSPPEIDGLDLDQAMHIHYGHIGPMFVQWCLDNMEFVQREVNVQYRKMRNEASLKSGRGHYDNFIIATQVCARMGAIWLHKAGLVPGWDMTKLLDGINRLADETHEEVNNLTSVDPMSLWNSIMRAAQGRVVATNEQGAVVDYGLPANLMSRGGPVIRYDMKNRLAYLSVLHCRKITADYSCDWSETERWIMGEFATKKQRHNLTAGMDRATNVFEECFVVPLEKVAAVIPTHTTTAQDVVQGANHPPPLPSPPKG